MGDTRKTQDTADTLPAASDSPAKEPSERTHRPTIPDIAPPFEQRYRLGAELGRGGMGRVVEAFDTQLGRTVALKEVLPRGGATGVDKRFEREVQITARLEHPSIVPLYDAGTMPDGRAFYVMRRVTGRPLDELINRARDLEERLVLLPNVLAALDAIAHAHKRGIIHRDLKPANILVGENGETIVIDWGLAKVIGEEDVDPGTAGAQIPSAADSLQTVAGAVFGTPGFMAPEQARGEELTPRGDVFALGATLYTLLVGKPPVGGRSATEAIESSMQRKIVPVAQAAPHAPVELVAIVEKALMFEPKDRYTNAGGLAEDVRRFLTGQVVAAHRYTRRELIKRFAKRHRAPLSVAALAMVAVAVIAWIGVHRILVERDVANRARTEADTQSAKVMMQNGQLVEERDKLLITRARAVVDSNPTEALALLKSVKPTSPRIAEARAIAQAAVHRGVPWALHSEGVPRQLSVDTQVHHLAIITMDGTLHVWDLETHRLMYDRMYDRLANGAWIAGDKLLLCRPSGVEILDPRTATIEHLAGLPPSNYAETSEDGQRAVIRTTSGELGVLEIPTRKWTPIWVGHKADHFVIPPDASFIATTDDNSLATVLAPDGKVLVERTGKFLVEDANEKSVAFFAMSGTEGKPIELDMFPTPSWHDDVMPMADKNFPVASYYRAGDFEVVTATSILHFKDHVFEYSTPMVEFSAFAIHELGAGIEILASRDGSLHFVGAGAEGHIVVPASLSSPHLVGHRNATRFAAAGTGVVFIYDMADIVPPMFRKGGEQSADFLDGNTLLMWPDDLTAFYTRDLATGETHAFKHQFNMNTMAIAVDVPTGRMLLAEPGPNNTITLVEVQKGHYDQVKRYGSALKVHARLTKQGFIVAKDNDPRVLYAEHDEQMTELAKVDGGVQSMIVLDNDRFAALSRNGELVRGGLHGGPLERIHVDVDANAFLGIETAGRAVVVTGAKISIWDATLRPFVELPRAIQSVDRVSGGLLAVLDNNATYLVDDESHAHELFTESSTGPTVGGNGTWVASAGAGGQISIVELPSQARWSLPQVYSTSASLLVGSPTNRHLLQNVPPQMAVWDLAQVKGDFATWLDSHTNAFENDDGFVSWPWLRPQQP